MTSDLTSVDIARILQLLPHRYPFLMIDRIKQMRGDEFCIGIKNVTINEPHFRGIFRASLFSPGVLLIEAMAQCAGAMCIASRPVTEKPPLVYFMTIDEAKFRKPVVPGDVVEFHMNKLKYRRNMWWFKGEAKVEGENVAEAIVSAMIVTPEK